MRKTLYIPIDLVIEDTVECDKLIKRGDTLTLTIKVFNNGVLANLTGQSIDLILKKADNTLIEKTIDVSNVSNGVITATLEQQATLASGLVSGEVQLYTNGTLASTNTFTYNVSSSLADDVLEVSTDDIQVLADLRNLIEDGQVAITEYENSVLAIGNTVEAIEALANIKAYIDTNLEDLENANAQAVINIANETTQNSQAVQNITDLTSENATATSNISVLTELNTHADELETNLQDLATQNINATINIASLTTQNTNATGNISNLQSENTRAETNIDALEQFGDLTGLTNDVNSLKTEMQNARGGQANLDARLDGFDVSINEKANKNHIINGNLDIWQRGASFVNPPNFSATADRFTIAYNLTGVAPSTLTHSRQIVNSSELLGSQYFYRINSDSLGVLNSSDNYMLIHPIENGVKKLCGTGKKITISFMARSSIANKKIGLYASKNYGSGGTPSVADVLNGSFVILASQWKKYVVTLDGSDISSKIFGTNNDDVLKIRFVISYGSNIAPNVGDTVAETFGVGNIDIAQIKLELGSIATPFVPRPIGEELALCMRYFENCDATSSRIINYSANTLTTKAQFKVEKRVAPAIIVTIGGVNSTSQIEQTGFTFSTSGSTKLTNASIIATKTAHGVTDGYISFSYTADAEIY